MHGLVGISRDKIKVEEKWSLYGISDSKLFDASHTSFGAALGGGLDIPVGNNLSIRVIQADYYLTNHKAVLGKEVVLGNDLLVGITLGYPYKNPYDGLNFDNNGNVTDWKGDNKIFNNVNLSFGVVFRFGN